MTIKREVFGHFEGHPVHVFTLKGPRGITARVMEYGAMLLSLEAPDRHGSLADITLGYAGLAGYQADQFKVGALCGRVVNRIGRGHVSIKGREYRLPLNEGANHIHGGPHGFDRHWWQGTADEARNAVTFSRLSPDGEEGYPGNLTTHVTYAITADGGLAVSMRAETDATTIVNLACHAYWNLAGHDAGPVLGHRLMIDADHCTQVDAGKIPTGEIIPVAGTVHDFRQARPIGQSMPAEGHDINFCLNGPSGHLRLAARLEHEASGRGLEVHTDQPGLQLYTGAGLHSGLIGKDGVAYGPFGGIALETQKFADAPNHPNFPSIELEPGETYRHNSLFRFLIL